MVSALPPACKSQNVTCEMMLLQIQLVNVVTEMAVSLAQPGNISLRMVCGY